MKYTCFVYGEGGKEKRFLMDLMGLDKFKYHTTNWHFNYGNASGCSPAIILGQCRKEKANRSYDLTLCFIDLDKLKHDFPSGWVVEQKQLENKYSDIQIIWQEDSIEDVYKKVLGDQGRGKHRLNKDARNEIKKFINSEFWKKILTLIKKTEEDLSKSGGRKTIEFK